MQRFAFLPLALILVGASHATGQAPKSKPTPPSEAGRREIIELRVPSLAEEIGTSEVEPRLGEIRMNLRFMRAQYSRPKIGNSIFDKYDWNYFPDANVTVMFASTPIGAYSLTSAEERRTQLAKATSASLAANPNAKIVAERDVAVGDELGKEYDVSSGSGSMTMRVLVHNGIYYLITVEAKKPEARPQLDKLLKSFEFVPLPKTAASVENNAFRSVDGNFTIDLPIMPLRTIERSGFGARLKKVDAGRQFIWGFNRNSVTLYYTPPFTPEGEPEPMVFADMETGTRKAIINAGLTIASEKPFKSGPITGTEFRYVAAGTVNFVVRVFTAGNTGYQLMGSYPGPKDEADVVRILDSFRTIGKKDW